VYHTAWNPGAADVFLSASGDTTVRIWDLRHAGATLVLPAHAFEVLTAGQELSYFPHWAVMLNKATAVIILSECTLSGPTMNWDAVCTIFLFPLVLQTGASTMTASSLLAQWTSRSSCGT